MSYINFGARILICIEHEDESATQRTVASVPWLEGREVEERSSEARDFHRRARLMARIRAIVGPRSTTGSSRNDAIAPAAFGLVEPFVGLTDQLLRGE
jgi:hypothetical protein